MLSRKQNDSGIEIPPEVTSGIHDILTAHYKEKLQKENSEFEIFGKCYPDEISLSIALVSKIHDMKAPVTLIMSVDFDTRKPITKVIDQLITESGYFFDDLFDRLQNSSSSDTTLTEEIYQPYWVESKSSDIDYYFMVTRENMRLTLIADSLLKSQ